jgi:hypothetical protein
MVGLSARLATRENRVVRSRRRDRMTFSFPRGAVDDPGFRFAPKRGADVRNSFTRGCAARCCSGRSLKCKPARPLNQMTTLVRINRRRSRAAALATTQDRSPGRMAGDCGFSTAVIRTGFSPNCYSTLDPVGTSKSAAPAIGGHARPPVLSSAERSPADADERKRRRAGSPRGS